MSEDVFNNQVEGEDQGGSDQQGSGETTSPAGALQQPLQTNTDKQRQNQMQNRGVQSSQPQSGTGSVSASTETQPRQPQQNTTQENVHQEVYSEEQPQQNLTQDSKQDLIMRIGVVSMVVSIIIAAVYLLI